MLLWLVELLLLGGTAALASRAGQAPSIKSAMAVDLIIKPAMAVDLSNAPIVRDDGWEPARTSPGPPFGSFDFSASVGDVLVCRASVYASMGLPSDALDDQWLEGGPRCFELFDIETTPAFRREGYASALIEGMLAWLGKVHGARVADVIFARDASGIEHLYSKWGFTATADDGYEHVFLKRLHDQDASETWRRVSVGVKALHGAR